jgi:BASS family bile acid:Na+ symporter
MSPPRITGETVAGFLDRWLLGFVVLVAAVGLAAPRAGRIGDAHAGILVVLAVLVATAGATVEVSGLIRLKASWRPLLVTVLVSTGALPGLAWLAARLVSAPALRDGVLAAGVAPAEVASIGLAAAAGAETALTALLLIASTLATVALAGPWLSLLTGAGAGIDTTGLLITLVLVVILPLGIGIGLRARWPQADALQTVAGLAGTVALLVLVYLVAAQIPPSVAYLPVLPALLAYLTGAALLGWALSRLLAPVWRPAVLLPVAMRDFAVAAGIATAAFGPAAAAPLGAYGVLVLLFGALVSRHARHASRR